MAVILFYVAISNLPISRTTTSQDFIVIVQLHGPLSAISEFRIVVRSFNEILWNNQFLRIGNKPLFSKKLFAKGIFYVSHILSEDGKLLSWNHFRGKELNFNDYLLIFGLSKAFPGIRRTSLLSRKSRPSSLSFRSGIVERNEQGRE